MLFPAQVSTLTVHKRTSHGVIEADDGTEIVLGDMFTQKVLKNANMISDTRKLKGIKTVTTSVSTLHFLISKKS